MKKYVIIMITFMTLVIVVNIKAHDNREVYVNEIAKYSMKFNEENHEIISKDEAKKIVLNNLKLYNSYIPNNIEVDSEDEESYIIHAYDVIYHEGEGSHTATIGWYKVNKKSGELTDIIN